MKLKIFFLLAIVSFALFDTAGFGQSKKPRIDQKPLAAVELSGKYGFIDQAGNWVIPAQFANTAPFHDQRAMVEINGKNGFIDKTGKLVIAAQLELPAIFSEGLAAIEPTADAFQQAHTRLYYIDLSGKMALTTTYQGGEGFHEQLARVWAPDEKSGVLSPSGIGRFGFIDKTGKVVIPFTGAFDEVGNFSEGLAFVYCCGPTGANPPPKSGFINKTGKLVIPLRFDGCFDFREGLAAVQVGVEYNSDGSTNPNVRWGFIDKTGKIVIPAKFNSVRSFSGGLASFCEGRCSFADLVAAKSAGRKPAAKYGFINKTGKVVIPAQFEYVGEFSEGLAAVSINRKWGFIDRRGQMVIAPQYDWANAFSQDRAVVRVGKKFGYIDNTGKVVIAPQFGNARDFTK